ncbi:hypothetical protein Tco_1166674 [Tanacetum coccineum]
MEVEEEPPLSRKNFSLILASLGALWGIKKVIDVNGQKAAINPGVHWLLIVNKWSQWLNILRQIKNKNTKKGNAMYYPRFTNLIVNFVMAKDPSIPRRNKVNWHYARDDPMFTTINVISRNEDTQLYWTILPAELRNEDWFAVVIRIKVLLLVQIQ